MGKSVSGRRNIKCKGPKIETCLLSVRATGNGMVGEGVRKRGSRVKPKVSPVHVGPGC